MIKIKFMIKIKSRIKHTCPKQEKTLVKQSIKQGPKPIIEETLGSGNS